MVKYYYDTTVFGYFVFTNDWEHEYSPTKVNGYSSVFCDEELIYVSMRGKFYDWGKPVPFMELSERLLDVGSLFSVEEVDTRDLRTKFLGFLGYLAQNGVNLQDDFSKPGGDGAGKPMEGMDWLHLTMADLLGCDTVLTSDMGFGYLKKAGKYIHLENVKKIIIFTSEEKLEKKEEIDLSAPPE
jgi:hypothetical protein